MEEPPEQARTGRTISLETLRAAGLALAALVANGIAAIFTVVFARVLGATDYGSLAALVATFLILSVPGSALQVAVARECAMGHLGSGHELWVRIAIWTRLLAIACVGACVVAILLRDQLAALIGVEQEWAAAATVPTGCIWLLLCVQRGALQGIHVLRPVGISIVAESAGRLMFGLLLVGLGAGVTGAYLGSPISMLLTAGVLAVILRRHAEAVPESHAADRDPLRLRELIRGAWAPVTGLTLIAILQNLDTIIVKRQAGGDEAGSYAVASVAGKVVLWVAIGLGLYLLPEAARRARHGLDARPALLRVLALTAAIAVPVLAAYALAGELLLEIAFGPDLTLAADALPWLGLAMTLLAASYLCGQHMLALHSHVFLIPLAVAAIAEPLLLVPLDDDLTAIAMALAGLQGALVVVLAALALRRPRAGPG